MKKSIAVVSCVLAMGMVAGGLVAADKPVLGVAEFQNGVGGLHWWYSGVGWDLASMLTNELAATGSFKVVERSNLESVLREQDLGDYGRVRAGTAAQVGQLTGAQYLVMGTVSAYEEDVKGTGGGIGYRGIRLGGKKEQAYLAVDLRVVDTTTGDVEYVRTVEGRAGGKGISVGLWRSGFSGNLSTYEKTPAGKAIRAALIEIVDYLDCAMVTQGGCMAEYDAKERSRREKTKGSIKLD